VSPPAPQILAKGELQVSEKERQVVSTNTFHEVAVIIADKCVNPDTRLPYPVSLIEKAMRDLHFSVRPNQSAKQQVRWPHTDSDRVYV
jgi:ribosome maturation protein SDO1